MDPIETLMAEHRNIEQALDALDYYAARVRSGEAVEQAELGRFAKFIREYADAYHHGKEEDMLFTAMVDNGFPKEAGPIGMMLMEHDQGRALVGQMRELSERTGAWSAEERLGAVNAANGFSGLLRAHIHKEDRILYPMAEAHLPPDTMEKLERGFAQHATSKAGVEKQLLALGEELAKRWNEGASAKVPGGQLGGCSCGH